MVAFGVDMGTKEFGVCVLQNPDVKQEIQMANGWVEPGKELRHDFKTTEG